MSVDQIEKQARYLAKDNREVEPTISNVYWFPSETEVRLVELTTQIPKSDDNRVHPFYFRSSKKPKLPYPSAIAMIRPDELNKLKLPEGWGTWKDAKEIGNAN